MSEACVCTFVCCCQECGVTIEFIELFVDYSHFPSTGARL